MSIYTKPALSITKQIALLKAKNLIINEEKLAYHYLTTISYYRLSGYFKAFQKGNRFIEGTSFDRIIELYNIDRRLRVLFLEALEKIEIAVKALVSNHLSLKYGAHWYENKYLKESGINKIVLNHKGIYDRVLSHLL